MSVKKLINRIVHLENDKNELNHKLNSLQQQYHGLHRDIVLGQKYHSRCFIKVKPSFKPNLFDLKISKVENKDKCVKFLGYTLGELESAWSIGKWFPPKKHPIFDIMRKAERKEYKKLNVGLFGMWNFFDKSFTPTISIVKPTVYTHKEGHDVRAMFNGTINLIKAEIEIRTTFNYASNKN